MKKNTVKKSLIKNRRGATIVEYAAVAVAVTVGATAAYKGLGGAAKTAAENSEKQIR